MGVAVTGRCAALAGTSTWWLRLLQPAEAGRLEVLQRLRAHGCPRDAETRGKWAAKDGHLAAWFAALGPRERVRVERRCMLGGC